MIDCDCKLLVLAMSVPPADERLCSFGKWEARLARVPSNPDCRGRPSPHFGAAWSVLQSSLYCRLVCITD